MHDSILFHLWSHIDIKRHTCNHSFAPLPFGFQTGVLNRQKTASVERVLPKHTNESKSLAFDDLWLRQVRRIFKVPMLELSRDGFEKFDHFGPQIHCQPLSSPDEVIGLDLDSARDAMELQKQQSIR